MKNPRTLFFLYGILIIICLTSAGVYAHHRYQKVNTPPNQTSILRPKDGEQVARQIFAMGEFMKADSLKELWLVVQPIDSVLYHPQPGPLQKVPRRPWWHTTVYFGEADDVSGRKYHVFLFSATEEASKSIKGYLADSDKTGRWPGMKALPDGLMPLDTITVIRNERKGIK
ncbi:hypothetical protein JW906_15215 [bacterium]|nr:hypothetical protein [bacterium]